MDIIVSEVIHIHVQMYIQCSLRVLKLWFCGFLELLSNTKLSSKEAGRLLMSTVYSVILLWRYQDFLRFWSIP